MYAFISLGKIPGSGISGSYSYVNILRYWHTVDKLFTKVAMPAYFCQKENPKRINERLILKDARYRGQKEGRR